MSLTGNISTMPLPDLLQWLALTRKDGCLRLEREKHSTWIFFAGGRIVACASDDPPTLLGQFLLFHGVITKDVLRRAMKLQEETGRSLSELIPELAGLSREELERHVAAKAEETMLGLFELGDASFDFKEDLPPGRSAMKMDLAVQQLVLDGMKRLDDTGRIRAVFDSADVVVGKTATPPPPALLEDPATRHTYAAVDGRRTVGEILLYVHGGKFQVTKRLFDLLGQGLIELAPARPKAPEPPSGALEAAPTPPAPPPSVETTETEPSPAPSLDDARSLVKRRQFEDAMELIEPLFRADPGNQVLRSLVRAIEAGLVEQIAEEGLSPNKIPVPLHSREQLTADDLSPAEEYVLAMSDGSWDVKSLTWIAPMRSADLMAALKGLMSRGIIELRNPR